jgi:glycine cleavage system aminomethyltransferase T
MTATTDHNPVPSPLTGVFPESTTSATIGGSVVAWDFGDLAAEYAAIRENAAKIDLSSATLVLVTGGDAYDLLQTALARDLEFVTPEQSLSSLLLSDDGQTIDLVTAYYTDEGFRLETAFGRAKGTAAHLAALAESTGLDAQVAVDDETTMILIEGPNAAKILEEMIDPDLGALPLAGIMEVEFAETQLLVSRSGFTGEYGYKLFVAKEDAEQVWNAIDLPAAGIGALEAAMFEVRQPVLHREDTLGGTALENGYGWLIDITKESFTGQDAVQGAYDDGVRADVIGFVAPTAQADVPSGTPISIGGVEIGKVVHSVYSPGRKEYIGLAKVRPDLVAPKLTITIGAAGAESLTGVTLAAPYFLPVSWRTR